MAIGGACLLLAAACGGGGQYGYARQYEPLDAEEKHMREASTITYEEVRRDPNDFRSSTLGWFGIVQSPPDVADDGKARVHMTFRTHQERHLCEEQAESSCRVTVSDKAGGPWTAVVELRPGDIEGETRVWQGSLLKVYGSPTGEFDEQGGPVVEADWYRHWPRGKFVTTAMRSVMRK